MTDNRRDARLVFILSPLIFVIAGFMLDRSMPWSMVDYKQHYYAARCFLSHGDPYNEKDLAKVYPDANPSWRPTHLTVADAVATIYIYPPSDLLFVAPLAFIPFQISQTIWFGLTVIGLIVASALMLDVGFKEGPLISAALIGLMLLNSEMMAVLGNSAGLSISLCVVSAWCLLKGERPRTGIACLAVSLLLKPQDGIALLAFLLLAGAMPRKRAVAAMLTTVALGLPAVLWITIVAPHWLSEWSANMRVFSAPGGVNDPGPSSVLWPNVLLNLQTVVSLVDNRPFIYDLVTYAVGAPILLLCFAGLKRAKGAVQGQWQGLAIITALTLAVTYHRRNDSKLLLLAIPICAELWSRRGWKGRAALVITAAAIFLTGDNYWLLSNLLIDHLATQGTPLFRQLEVLLLVLPGPLSLLLLAVFHLQEAKTKAAVVAASA